MSDYPTGWCASVDDEATGDWKWQPTLAVPGMCLTFDMWFVSQDDCMAYIREEILGQGLWPFHKGGA